MTFKEYLKQLNELAKDNPEALGLKVYTATDDEGNDFKPVYYSPALNCLTAGEINPAGTINAVVLN